MGQRAYGLTVQDSPMMLFKFKAGYQAYRGSVSNIVGSGPAELPVVSIEHSPCCERSYTWMGQRAYGLPVQDPPLMLFKFKAFRV